MALVVRGAVAGPGNRRAERERGADAGSGSASGGTGISPACSRSDGPGVRGRRFADVAEHGRTAAAGRSAGAVRGPAPATERRRNPAFSQLLALGAGFDRALSN